MADTTALVQARSTIAKINADRAAEREIFLKKQKELREAQKAAELVAAKERRELKKELRGPDVAQMGADVAGLVVGEGTYRLIGLGLAKLGVKHWAWYTLPGAVGGTVLYVLAYPRREEGAVRAGVRALGLTWQIISLHDSVSFLMEGSSQTKAAVVRAAEENQQLRQQLAQLQRPAQQAR